MGGAARMLEALRAQPGASFLAGAPGRQGLLHSWRPGGKRVNTQPEGPPSGNGCKGDTKNKSSQRAAPPPPRAASAGGATGPAASRRARAPTLRGCSISARPAATAPTSGSQERSSPARPARPGPSGGIELCFALFVGQAQLCYWR